MNKEELEKLKFENVFTNDIPLLDELYIVISNEKHDSGYLMYKIYGVAYGKNREIIYAKCLSDCSDVINITPTFIRGYNEYRLPLLSIDSIELNLFRIFTRNKDNGIKVESTFSDFEFEIVEVKENE